MGFVYVAEREGFWVEGPLEPATLNRHTWFPPDALVERRRGRDVEALRWDEFVSGPPLRPGDSARLPANPTGAGPLLYVMRRLLDPQGCPWDREQTPRTLIRYVLDEAYEAAAAILDEDWDLTQDELGDVLLQVVFQSALAARSGRFDFEGVVQAQAQKLVRRHPHVFGGERVASGADVLARWESWKAAEPHHGLGDESVMPALMAASRAAKRGVQPAGTHWEVWRRELEAQGAAEPGAEARLLAEWMWAGVTQARRWHQEAEWVLWEAIRRLQKHA